MAVTCTNGHVRKKQCSERSAMGANEKKTKFSSVQQTKKKETQGLRKTEKMRQNARKEW